MQAFRVHSSAAGLEGHVPYLLLQRSSSDRMSLDFSPLERSGDPSVRNFTLSRAGLYALLQGEPLHLYQGADLVTVVADGDSLRITNAGRNGSMPWEYRVWLVELALGWNLLAGPGSVGGTA